MTTRTLLAAAMIGGTLAATAPAASAGPDDYIGEIMLVGFNFCPRSTMPADGRLLPISQYTALFSLYGTMYGGDGRTTFALPDLRGRTVVGFGAGPGLSDRRIGETGGSETVKGGTTMPGPGNGGGNPNNPQGNAFTGNEANNMQPYTVLNYCVVTEGIFPSRS